jgi:hypothetical protein
LIALYTVGYRAEPLVRRNSGHIKKRRSNQLGLDSRYCSISHYSFIFLQFVAMN